MTEKISRRELARRGLIGAAALAVPSLLTAQEATPPAPKVDPDIDKKVANIEAKLAKPLSPKAKELLKAAIPTTESAATNRLKHTLPENSEPCFIFAVTPVAKRGDR